MLVLELALALALAGPVWMGAWARGLATSQRLLPEVLRVLKG